MRNLKRVLSLVMMVAMLCSVMLIGANAAGYDDFTDKDEIVNKTAVETLVELGVISGKEDGSYFAPQDNLTRAEAAKLVTVVLNGGTEPVLSDPSYVSYYDTQGTWGSKYIEYVTALNIAAGDGQGYFKPDESLTATQLAKMLLVGMGYDAAFEGMVGGTWDSKTDALANQKDLYEGLPADFITSAPINRDNAALIIYNALSENLVRYESAGQDGGVGVQAIDRDVTVLGEFFQVSEVKAVAVANDVFSLVGEAANKCAVDRSGYLVYERDNVAVANGEYKVLPYDLSNDIIGQSVTLYVKNYDRTTASVIGSVIVSEDNTVATTSQAFKDTDAVDSYLKTVGLTATRFDLSRNGGVVNANGDRTDLLNELPGVECRFIDNDGDGQVDVVLTTQYALGKIISYNTSTGKVTIASSTVNEDDMIAYEGMAKGDYVLYMQYGPTYWYVEKAETIQGTATAYDASANLLTVNGTPYAQSVVVNNASDLDPYAKGFTNGSACLGNSYTYYLDQAGNIIATGDYVAGVGNYAIVVASNAEKGSLNDVTGSVKLLKEDGVTASYPVDLLSSANNYIREWANVANNTAIFNYNNGENSLTLGALNSDKELAMASRLHSGNNTWNGTDGANAAGDGMLGEIVTYTVNDDGTVTLTPTTALKTNGLGAAGDDQHPVKTKARYTLADASSVSVNNDTLFFYIDNTGKTSLIKGVSNLPSTDNNSTVTAIAYTTTGTDKVAAAVYVSGTTTPASSYVYVTGAPTETVAADGSHIYTYSIIQDGVLMKGELKSRTGEVFIAGLYEVTYADGYATLKTDEAANEDTAEDALLSNYVVEDITSNTLTMTSAYNKDTRVSYPMADSYTVYDVTDLENPQEVTSFGEDNIVTVVVNKDGFVSEVYIVGNTSSVYGTIEDLTGDNLTYYLPNEDNGMQHGDELGNTAIADGTVVTVNGNADTTYIVTSDLDGASVGEFTTNANGNGSFTMPVADEVTIAVKP